MLKTVVVLSPSLLCMLLFFLMRLWPKNSRGEWPSRVKATTYRKAGLAEGRGKQRESGYSDFYKCRLLFFYDPPWCYKGWRCSQGKCLGQGVPRTRDEVSRLLTSMGEGVRSQGMWLPSIPRQGIALSRLTWSTLWCTISRRAGWLWGQKPGFKF